MNSAAGTNGAGGAEGAPLIELRDVVFSYAGHTVAVSYTHLTLPTILRV